MVEQALLQDEGFAGPAPEGDAPSLSEVQQLAVAGLPTTLLIDRNGNEVGRVVGSAEWDSPAALELVRGYTEESPLKAAAE